MFRKYRNAVQCLLHIHCCILHFLPLQKLSWSHDSTPQVLSNPQSALCGIKKNSHGSLKGCQVESSITESNITWLWLYGGLQIERGNWLITEMSKHPRVEYDLAWLNSHGGSTFPGLPEGVWHSNQCNAEQQPISRGQTVQRFEAGLGFRDSGSRLNCEGGKKENQETEIIH